MFLHKFMGNKLPVMHSRIFLQDIDDFRMKEYVGVADGKDSYVMALRCR